MLWILHESLGMNARLVALGGGKVPDKTQEENNLIIIAFAPAVSTYETDRDKCQLMQEYPVRDSFTWTLISEPSDYSNDCYQPRDTDGR